MTRAADLTVKFTATAVLLCALLISVKTCGRDEYKPTPDRWLQPMDSAEQRAHEAEGQ